MFESVTLEMSLKPFKKTDEKSLRTVCRQVFDQWYPLIKNRKTVSVLLWTADGSEILDYTGELTEPFEWCRWLGTANREQLGPNEGKETSLHERKQPYTKHPPRMTYGILKTIVSLLKEEGKRACPQAEIRVGETFDIGPEFAVSDFKYRRHPEITAGTGCDTFGFVDATALLHGDTHRYAAYPHGIPDKTPFGTFFGKQADRFLRDMGFDYLWLSNGLGFGAEPWNAIGNIFDGERFYAERLISVRQKVFNFWRLFREACPTIPLEVRGTNHSAGIDYATDGVPLYEIYTGGFAVTPPPNSPWAALNGNFGLELMGHMTRICELPKQRFTFRFYLHDPWWINSPWYDRYNGYPHDIYLPMAISRIREDGSVQSAEQFNILTVDNSFGDRPDCCVNESLPHLLKAEKDCADEPAPLVWVYPLRQYTAATEEAQLREMYEGDTFVSEAINRGLPLNCVVSADLFLRHDPAVYQKSILLSPVPEEAALAQKLEDFERQGGRVIYYGSRDRLAQVQGSVKVDSACDPSALRKALAQFGYEIWFESKTGGEEAAVFTLLRRDNGLFFSVYNPNTTTDTWLRFPLGAPLLIGGETELREGAACYRFPRADHRECRGFVVQKQGVVSVTEGPPVNNQYHRKLILKGLEDATVCLFPEAHCVETARVARHLPPNDSAVYPHEAQWVLVRDPKQGDYYRAEHISGDIEFLLPYKNR